MQVFPECDLCDESSGRFPFLIRRMHSCIFPTHKQKSCPTMHCRLLLELIVIKNYPHFAWMFSRSSVGQCLYGISVKRCLAGWSHTDENVVPVVIRGDVLVTGASRDHIDWPHTGKNVVPVDQFLPYYPPCTAHGFPAYFGLPSVRLLMIRAFAVDIFWQKYTHH